MKNWDGYQWALVFVGLGLTFYLADLTWIFSCPFWDMIGFILLLGLFWVLIWLFLKYDKWTSGS